MVEEGLVGSNSDSLLDDDSELMKDKFEADVDGETVGIGLGLSNADARSTIASAKRSKLAIWRAKSFAAKDTFRTDRVRGSLLS